MNEIRGFFRKTDSGSIDPRYSLSEARRVRRFHETFPAYAPTPLRSLGQLSEKLGLGAVFCKDENERFGLQAFKGLGGSYALGRILARRWGLSPEEMSFASLRRTGEGKAPLTFITATGGNHGRGVAWAARELGHRAVVLLPRGTAPRRLENILALGARAEITSLPYDDTVRLAARIAGERGWCLVQDTAWEGYEEIPRWIMQGYLTMAQSIGQRWIL